MMHQTATFKEIIRKSDRMPVKRKSTSYRMRSFNEEGISIRQNIRDIGYLPKIYSDEIFKINDDHFILLPHSLTHLKNVFTDSLYIVKLEDDWDDAGAKSYSVEVYKKSLNFIINFGLWINNNFSYTFSTPKIYHGPNGSIDILFNYNNSRVFFNIDADGNTGYFYANSGQAQVTEGHFNLNDPKYNLLPLPVE